MTHAEIRTPTHAEIRTPTHAEIRTQSTKSLNTKTKTKREKALLKNDLKKYKQKKSYCPGKIELVLSEEAKQIALDKKLDIHQVFYSFTSYMKSQGRLYVDWKKAFVKWLIDEKKLARLGNNPTVNQVKSTVQFWEPGNPDYDRVNTDRDLLAEEKVRDLNKANLIWTEIKNWKDDANGQMGTPRKE